MMGTCAGLVGPKSENVDFIQVFVCFFEGSRGPRGRQSRERPSEPRGLGGGRGRVNPPPRRLVWRFWEVWRVWSLVGASTRHEAQGLGGHILIFAKDFASQRRPDDAKRTKGGASRTGGKYKYKYRMIRIHVNNFIFIYINIYICNDLSIKLILKLGRRQAILFTL